jgi:hypothetical protein
MTRAQRLALRPDFSLKARSIRVAFFSKTLLARQPVGFLRHGALAPKNLESENDIESS